MSVELVIFGLDPEIQKRVVLTILCVSHQRYSALIPGVSKPLLPQAIQRREVFLELVISLTFFK